MNKKGVMREVVLGVIVAVLCLYLLFTAVSPLLASFFGKTDSQRAESTLEGFIASLNEANTTKQTVTFVALVPKNWWLASFLKGQGPSDCWQGDCVCICSTQDCKKDRKCALVEKKVLQNDLPISIQIPADIFITAGENYDIGVSSTTAWKPSNTEIDSWLGHNYQPLYGLGQCVLDASKRTSIPAEVILAVTIHESDGGKSGGSMTSCPLGPSQYSNNLFGIKGTGTAGTCLWETSECLTEEQKSKEDIIMACDANHQIDCGEMGCYRVNAKFKAYNNRCDSINDFAGIISTYSIYQPAMALKDNPLQMIYAIRDAGYATDPKWSIGVSEIAARIKSGMEAA